MPLKWKTIASQLRALGLIEKGELAKRVKGSFSDLDVLVLQRIDAHIKGSGLGVVPKSLSRRSNSDANATPDGVDSRRANSKDFLASFEWRSLRMMAFQKYGRVCLCCGASPQNTPGTVLNVDHVLPRKTHPELALDIENLQVLCGACNHGKGNKSGFDFRQVPDKIVH